MKTNKHISLKWNTYRQYGAGLVTGCIIKCCYYTFSKAGHIAPYWPVSMSVWQYIKVVIGWVSDVMCFWGWEFTSGRLRVGSNCGSSMVYAMVNPSIHYLYHLSFWGLGKVGANPSWHWAGRGGYTLDRLPIHLRADIQRQTTSHSHIHTYGQFNITTVCMSLGCW